jgi:hypothetical protein
LKCLKKSTAQPVRFEVERDGAPVMLSVTPEGNPGRMASRFLRSK